jgi:hypothetical protein
MVNIFQPFIALDQRMDYFGNRQKCKAVADKLIRSAGITKVEG